MKNIFPDYIYAAFWTDTNLRDNDLIVKMVKHFVETDEPLFPVR